MDWQSTQKIKDVKPLYLNAFCSSTHVTELLFIESPKEVQLSKKKLRITTKLHLGDALLKIFFNNNFENPFETHL